MNRIAIGEVCNVYDGPHATPTKIDKGPVYLGIDAITDNGKINPAGYNYLSEEDYVKWTKRVTPQYGDIVFSYEATLGRYALIPMGFYGCLGRRLAIVRPKDERINVKWLYYYFRSTEWSVFIKNNTVKGSTVDRISVEDFPKYEIPLIDRGEQDKIVAVLSAIDDKIDNNQKINDNLEQQARLIFDYWFGQNKYLNSEVFSCVEGHFSDLISINKTGDWGKSTPEGKYTQNAYCVRGADFPALHGKKQLNAPERYISTDNTYKYLEQNDIIVEISGGSPTQSTGRICYINQSTLSRFDKPVFASNFCRALSLKNDYDLYWFYLMWQKLYDSGVLFGFEGKTTGIKNLLFDIFCNRYIIAIPKDSVRIEFNKIVSPLFDKIQLNQIENDRLMQLRDWLLPMLMNGQATIED